MNNPDRKRFAELLGVMAEMYQVELTKGMIEAYFASLSPLSLAEFEAATFSVLRTARFMPKPADLLAAAGKGQRSKRERALRAWKKVEDAISHHGAYKSVRFEDPATANSIHAIGGWQYLCRPEEAWTWVRKQFLELYEVYADQPGKPQTFVGLCEQQNVGALAKYNPPVAVIDADDADDVLRLTE